MRFLLKVNIPVESRERSGEGGQARRDHPIHSGRFETGGRLLYR